MTRSVVLRALFVAPMLAYGAVASAAPIILDVDRFIQVYAQAGSDVQMGGSGTFATGPWVDFLAVTAAEGDLHATGNTAQNSNVGTLTFGGHGSGFAESTANADADAFGDSYFTVVFFTDQPYNYSFAGFLGATPTLNAVGNGESFARAELCSGTCLVDVQTSFTDLVVLNQAGTLDAGVAYTFKLTTIAQGNGTASFDAALVLTPVQPVPESTSMLLFGMAGLSLAAMRWRTT